MTSGVVMWDNGSTNSLAGFTSLLVGVITAGGLWVVSEWLRRRVQASEPVESIEGRLDRVLRMTSDMATEVASIQSDLTARVELVERLKADAAEAEALAQANEQSRQAMAKLVSEQLDSRDRRWKASRSDWLLAVIQIFYGLVLFGLGVWIGS